MENIRTKTLCWVKSNTFYNLTALSWYTQGFLLLVSTLREINVYCICLCEIKSIYSVCHEKVGCGSIENVVKGEPKSKEEQDKQVIQDTRGKLQKGQPINL